MLVPPRRALRLAVGFTVGVVGGVTAGLLREPPSRTGTAGRRPEPDADPSSEVS